MAEFPFKLSCPTDYKAVKFNIPKCLDDRYAGEICVSQLNDDLNKFVYFINPEDRQTAIALLNIFLNHVSYDECINRFKEFKYFDSVLKAIKFLYYALIQEEDMSCSYGLAERGNPYSEWYDKTFWEISDWFKSLDLPKNLEKSSLEKFCEEENFLPRSEWRGSAWSSLMIIDGEDAFESFLEDFDD